MVSDVGMRLTSTPLDYGGVEGLAGLLITVLHHWSDYITLVLT